MSTPSAIEEVTKRLLVILDSAQLVAECKPFPEALQQPALNTVNLFLYQVAISAAWRNQDLPAPIRGATSRQFLPLNLYYLITACAADQKNAHDTLGRAMLALFDNSLIGGFDPDSEIKNQTDPIRVTSQPLSLDEMTKLWSALQVGYRPSAAYEVGVVLIESANPAPSPLPVMQLGERNRGWDATTQRPARLEKVRFATSGQQGARRGETLTLIGKNLNQPGKIQMEFRSASAEVAKPAILKPDKVSSSEAVISVPIEWPHPAGLYLVSLQTVRGTDANVHTYSSNAIPIGLLPEILPDGGLAVNNDFKLIFKFKPPVLKNQNVQVLIGAQIIHEFVATKTISNLTAAVPKGIDPVGAFARLRVDGVDSPIPFNPANPNEFDPRYKVSDLPV